MQKAAIEIVDLKKVFGKGNSKNLAINSLSLTVKDGEIFGFLGPNGAGKSTTIKMLLRFIQPDSGSLKIRGIDISEMEFRHKIGYLSEFPFFYEHLTARETLVLSGRLSGMSKTKIDEQIDIYLERMNLSEAADRRVGGFSKGMKQRLGMANALIHDPSILIFDEPMSGLDPVGRHQIKALILELNNEGKTIFFSSHILSDIESICDNVGIINKGRLLFFGGVKEVVSSGKGFEEYFIKLIEDDNYAQGVT